MSEKTKIQWTDHTFNVAWGCTKISPGCANCYAEKDSHRYGFDVWGPGTERRTFGDKHWNEPLKWEREAEREGRRHRVFTSSMCDVLEDHPTIDAQRPRLLALIDATPHLDWQVLTKRAERLALIPERPNIWLGVSVESAAYVHRIDALRAVPAAVRFISFEPLLASLGRMKLAGIHWAIFGGESQTGARACGLGWIRDGMAECRDAGVAVFVKQVGAFPLSGGSMPERPVDRKGGDPAEWPEDLRVREFPKSLDAGGDRGRG